MFPSPILLLLVISLDAIASQSASETDLLALIKTLQSQVSSLERTITAGFTSTCKTKAKDCHDHRMSGKTTSGVYTIYPTGSDPIKVYCYMDNNEEGWTVIQKRYDGSENFYRSFHDYEVGFGNLTGEHWLGNEKTHVITSQCTYRLRVLLTDYQNVTKIADYKEFSVGDKASKYVLHVTGYSGDAGDSLAFDHNGHPFSTADADNDGSTTSNCAQKHHGGYWYSNCFKSNINGDWGKPGEAGIVWGSYKSWTMYVLKETTMMIRPVNCD